MRISWRVLVLVFSLLIATHCKVIQQPVDVHSSPLDPTESTKSSKLEQPSFWVHGTEYAIEPPPCHTACTAPVVEVLTVFFRSDSFKDSMYKACTSYHEAVACMLLHNHCGTDSMFESLTSGLKYMCKEQIEAFTALADCIDENSARVRKDCDAHCHSNSLATGLVLKDTVMTQLDHPLVSKNVNMRRIIEPHMSRIFFSEGCRIGECLMGCTRTKFNMLCEGTAGSLLLEMLTRPLSTRGKSAFSFPSMSHLASFLGGFLPRTCSFLTTPGRGHSGFRIDPELDKEIKRMYSDKNRVVGVPLPSPLSEPVIIENPFLEVSNLFQRASPIDTMAVPDPELLGSGAEWEEEWEEEDHQFEESSGVGVEQHRALISPESASKSDVKSTIADKSLPKESAVHENDLAFLIDKTSHLPSHPVKAGEKYKVHTLADADVQALQANLSATSSRNN